MLKSKMMFGMIAMAISLAFAPSGYAQLVFNTVTGNPSPKETATNYTAETNDPTLAGVGLTISGQVMSDLPITGGRLRITYPSTVTNACIGAATTCATPGVNVPAADPIRISFASGIFATSSVVAVNAAAGTVDIALPCGSQNPGASGVPQLPGGPAENLGGTMVLEGVRIDANAITSFPASATLSLVSGIGAPTCGSASVAPSNVTIGVSSVPVINASAAGIGSTNAGGMATTVKTPSTAANTVLPATSLCVGNDAFHASCGAATIYTNGTIPKGVASFTVTEGYADAWFYNDSTQFAGDQGDANGASFRLTFANIPSGVTLTLAIADYTSGTPSLSNSTITATNNTSFVTWGSDLSTTATDAVTFRITGITTSATSLTAGTNVTVSSTMYPLGTSALNTSGTVPDIITTPFPRFLDAEVGSAVVASVVPANTTMMIPFATTIKAINYDTGIAIANSSADPFGTTGAMPTSGTVTVWLYGLNAAGTPTTDRKSVV